MKIGLLSISGLRKTKSETPNITVTQQHCKLIPQDLLQRIGKEKSIDKQAIACPDHKNRPK